MPVHLWIYNKFPLVGALSGNALSGPINSLLGHDIPGVSMQRHIAVHDERTREVMPGDFDGDLSVKLHPATTPQGVTWDWESDVPADFQHLWEEFQRTGIFTTDRTDEYYRWRIATAPFVDYRFISVRRDGAIIGFAVIRFQETPAGTACRIVEFISHPSDASDGFQAIAAACAAEGALFSDFHVIGDVYDTALSAARYSRPESDPVFDAIPNLLSPVDHRKWTNTFNIGGRLARKNQDWRRSDRVYFTKADSDRDWPTKYELARQGVE